MQKMLPILGRGRSLPVVRDLELHSGIFGISQLCNFNWCSVFDSPLNPKAQDP